MYKSVQACRAVAALLVVLFHLGFAVAADKYFAAETFAIPFSFGNAGVDLFFVLSGFIITSVHRRDFGQPSTFTKYWRKRLVRIYPTYWIVFLAVYILAVASPSLRSTMPQDPVVILKSLMLLPQDPADVGGTGAPVLIVAWSLQYEMLFYALISIFILSRFAGIAVIGLLVFNYASCSMTSCGFMRGILASNWMILFLFGTLIGRCYHLIRLPYARTIAVLSVAAFAASGVLEIVAGPLAVDRRIVFGFFSGSLLLGLVKAEDAGLIRLNIPRISRLGDASYAMYLIHFPLVSIACKLAIGIGLSGYRGAAIAYPLIVSACIVVSLAFQSIIEAPVLRALRRNPAAQAVRLADRQLYPTQGP